MHPLIVDDEEMTILRYALRLYVDIQERVVLTLELPPDSAIVRNIKRGKKLQKYLNGKGGRNRPRV